MQRLYLNARVWLKLSTLLAAGTLSVQHAAGSPSVSYNGDSTVIQADLELSEGASATCTLSRGDSEIVSKDCKYPLRLKSVQPHYY